MSSANAQFEQAAMVHFERMLPGSVDRVWQFLIEADRVPQWYGTGAIEARVGGAVTLMDGHVRGVVTQCRPPRLLAYTWNVYSPGETESPYPESFLTLALEPRGDCTHLRLTHLPVLERFEKQNAMGWHTFLDLVEAALRGDSNETRQTFMQRNAQRYGIDLSNLTR